MSAGRAQRASNLRCASPAWVKRQKIMRSTAMTRATRRVQRPRICAVLAAAGMIALASSSIEQALAQTKIVQGFVSHGALQWPEYIASEFGWFKENGVAIDMVVVGGGAAQQVAAGALNLGYSGFPDFIRAINQGAPVKIVINAISAPPYAVYAKPAI